MQTPAAYTLLGIALALGTVAAVGFGGVQWWYLWETNFNDRSDEDPQYGASASCSDPADVNDPLGIGMDLVLSQDANTNQVAISGLITGGSVRKGTGVRLRLSSDKSCNPKPNSFSAGTIVTPAVDNYAEVNWSLPGYRLDGTGDDIIGDVIVVQTPSGTIQACCTITSLPGAGITSRRRRAVSPRHSSERRR